MNKKKDARKYCQEGRSATQQNDLQRAIIYYTRAINLDKGRSTYLLEMANAIGSRERHGSACSLYKSVVAMDPKNALAYHNLGVALSKLGKTDESIETFKEVLLLDPDDAAGHHNLALLLSRKGKYEEAEQHFLKALKQEPLNALIHYNFGVILEKLGKDDESLEMYQKALCLDPDYSDGHYNLAKMLTTKGKYKEALEHYSKVLELQPSDASLVSNNVGCLYFVQGMFAKASEEFQKSISLAEKFTPAYCNMSLVLFCENKPEEALRYFKDGMKTLDEDQNKPETLKEMIESCASKKTRFEAEFNSDEMLNRERRALLRTMINGLTEIINLLTQQRDQ